MFCKILWHEAWPSGTQRRRSGSKIAVPGLWGVGQFRSFGYYLNEAILDYTYQSVRVATPAIQT